LIVIVIVIVIVVGGGGEIVFVIETAAVGRLFWLWGGVLISWEWQVEALLGKPTFNRLATLVINLS
jgi:hypothetical protein